MPSAGGITPPTITPLRKLVPGGKFSTHIDTATYIELTTTENEDSKIFFTTDGSKPNIHQKKVAGKEVTFKYKGPFSLRAGKRCVKAITVARDGLKESLVISKTFQVEEAGLPTDTVDQPASDWLETSRSENDFKPIVSRLGPKPAVANQLNQRKHSIDGIRQAPREAWPVSKTADILASTYDSYDSNGQPVIPTNNSVQLPEGPFNATNYSGTQLNFWGVAPANIPPWIGGTTISASQLGAVTNSILQSMDQPRLSLADVRQVIQAETERLNSARQPVQMPKPVIEYVTKEPELKPESAGNGDWKAQIEHIYAHLVNQCQLDTVFRNKIRKPKLGKITNAEFGEDNECFLLQIRIVNPDYVPPKPKPTPPPPAPTRPITPPQRPPPQAPASKPKPKIDLKTLATVAAKVKQQPPKKKEETKEEKLKKRDPFFETEEYLAEGTLKPWPTFNAEVDCERLRKAMKGLGTDEKTIIDILGYRNANQRVEIALSFKTMFGKDLASELDSELSGNFRSCSKALLSVPSDYDASQIKKAVKGLGTDEDALIEILCTRTNAQIKAINDAYQKLYNKSMEKDVIDDTSGYFKRLLVSQIQGNRDESKTFDRTAAIDDAQALYQAGEAKWGTDESKFNEILCERSFAHLRAVFDEYTKVSKKPIEKAIESEFSGDIKQSLLTVVQVIRDKPGYFAQKLRKAMKGLGTDDDALVRIVVSRCECDMVQIKQSFQKLFNAQLTDWIKDDCSGDYKEILLALTGERAPPAPVAEEPDAGEPELEQVEEEHIVQEGTLKASDNFNANRDCEVLKKAMKGLGTDEAAIIQVMGYRAISQRLEIVRQFKTMYGKDFVAELKSELSGNFCHTMTSLCKTPAEHDADELRKAMKGLGTDEDCLVEIICTRSNSELKEIATQYQLRHGKKLEDSITSETSGNLKRLLVSLLQANRPEGNVIDRRKARKDAKALFEAGENKFGTDESRFNVILCSRSYPQLRATFDEYEKLSGKTIETSISSEMSGDLKKGMLTVAGCIKNKVAQFAKTLYESMKGLGTNDLSLTRTVVSRCEIDMVQIKSEFESAYKQPLGKFIKEDTSGDYMKILLTLTGDQTYIK